MKAKVLWLVLTVGLGVGVSAAQKAPRQPLQFIKSMGVVLIEQDTDRQTITINGPAIATDQWMCTRYEHGKSCKRASEVAMFILQDGVEK
jgi:hypothetical protein